MPLSPAELKLVAKLLDIASNEFSNHGCNDFKADRDGDLTPDETAEIAARLNAHPKFGDPNEEHGHGSNGYFVDWMLMRYLALRITEKPETPEAACPHEDHEPEDCGWDEVGDDGERFQHHTGAEIWLTSEDIEGRRWRYKTSGGFVSNDLYSYEQARDLATLIP